MKEISTQVAKKAGNIIYTGYARPSMPERILLSSFIDISVAKIILLDKQKSLNIKITM